MPSPGGADRERLWRAFEKKVREEREDVAASLGFPAADPALRWEAKRGAEGVQVKVRGRSGAKHIEVFAPWSDLEQLSKTWPTEQSQSALQYLSSLIVYADDGSYRWQPHDIGNGIPLREELDTLRGDSHRGVLPHSDQRIIRGRLGRGESVYVEGKTGTGKRTLVRSVMTWWLTEPHSLIRLDMIDPADGAESVMYALLALPSDERYLVAIEGVQANREETERVFVLVNRLRADLDLTVSVLAAGWMGGTRSTSAFISQVQTFHTEPERVMRSLLNGAGEQEAEGIRKLAGENLMFARHAVDLLRETGSVPIQDEFFTFLAKRLEVDQVTDPSAREELYRLACLAEQEIDVPIHKEKARLGRRAWILNDLRDRRLIEVADTSYRVVGRSLARVIGYHAVHHWHDPANGVELQPAAKLISDYVQLAGDDQIGVTLKRMSDIGQVDTQTNEIAAFLTNGFRHRTLIARHLRRRILDDDGRWGDNAAAAIYAGLAVAGLNDLHSWELTRNFIRDSWDVPPADSGQPPYWRWEEATGEAADFERMKLLMREEDTLPDAGGRWPQELSAARFEADLAHCTWILGLLLSFEGRAPDTRQDRTRLDALLECAKALHRRDGVFYPARMPMISAQVLSGLCDAGYRDEQVAHEVATWLRSRPNGDPLGGAFEMGGWRSGFGGAGDAKTAALCLIALDKHADDHSAGAKRTGLSQLNACTAGAESESFGDKALRLMAVLRVAYDRLPEVLPELSDLLLWAAKKETWNTAQDPSTRIELPDQAPVESAELALVVSLVLDMYWEILRLELPQIFSGRTDIASVSDLPRQEAGRVTAGSAPEAPVSGQDPEAPTPDQGPGTGQLSAERFDQLQFDMNRTGRDLDRRIEGGEKAARDRHSPKARMEFQALLNRLYEYKQRSARLQRRIDDGDRSEQIAQLLDELMRKLREEDEEN